LEQLLVQVGQASSRFVGLPPTRNSGSSNWISSSSHSDMGFYKIWRNFAGFFYL